jgi:hypothetical protein
MDPVAAVGLTASVAQLLNTTAKVIKYLNRVKTASHDRARLAREATSLLALLTEFRYTIEGDPADPWFASYRLLEVHGGPLEQLQEAMNEVVRKLKPKNGLKEFGMALLWPFSLSEIDGTLRKIERLKSHIGLAMQTNQL